MIFDDSLLPPGKKGKRDSFKTCCEQLSILMEKS